MDSLLSILSRTPDVQIETGHSGYFSAPQPGLDPALFKGDRITAEARAVVLGYLHAFWTPKYANPERWATIWLAGSGISYQWAGDRGNGDLDVLIGVDSTTFKSCNPKFADWGEEDIDAFLTQELREQLWPLTATSNIGGKTFEVTYFVNKRASDIRSIHPYAAYNLSDNSWTVRPPKLPAKPYELYPDDWKLQAKKDSDYAQGIVADFNYEKANPRSTVIPGILAKATRLFEEIHAGRSAAFSSSGDGYSDWNNFRWQFAKASGTIGALSQIVNVGRQYGDAESQRLYGGSISDSPAALRAAIQAVMRESEQGYGS